MGQYVGLGQQPIKLLRVVVSRVVVYSSVTKQNKQTLKARCKKHKRPTKAFKATGSVSKVVIYAWYVKNLAQFFKLLLSADSLDAALFLSLLGGAVSSPQPNSVFSKHNDTQKRSWADFPGIERKLTV